MKIAQFATILFFGGVLVLLTSCGGSSSTSPITSFELVDPAPAEGDLFGNHVAILTNGNVVVTDPFESSIASHAGAVHLYDPISQSIIHSTYSITTDDRFGIFGIITLANGNFVIASPFADVNSVTDAGTVQLFNGATGLAIGSAINGDADSDQLGYVRTTALSNGHFVITSPYDDVNGVLNAGSVQVINGTTGDKIGSSIVGDVEDDQIGSGGITELANGNFVISSPFDDAGGLIDAGSVKIINGETGVQIGGSIVGDTQFDQLGSAGITALVNGNYAIASPNDEVNGVFQVGSVILFNGETGVQIGSSIVGDAPSDRLGSAGITALANGNCVITSPYDDVGGIIDAGSIKLINGATGVQIGSSIVGETDSDQLGLSGTTALLNSNFVITSPFDDVNGVNNSGSARLVNGTSGAQIGSTISGDTDEDHLGVNGTTALSNSNFAIISPYDDLNNVIDAGSVRLINGTTGVPIGITVHGDSDYDRFGFGGVAALANGNFVVASPYDDVNGVTDAGSVQLINGTTGAPIGSTIVGSFPDDVHNATIKGSATGDFYVLGLPQADNNALVSSGLVRLIAQ